MDILQILQSCADCYTAPTIKAGPDGRDGASVCTLPTGETLLTFSGTPTDGDFRSILAWKNDFDFELVHADGFLGRVHRGFLSSLNNLWGGVIDALEGKPPEPPPPVKPWWKIIRDRLFAAPWQTIEESVPPPLPWDKDLWIVGHSLGGALAQMAGVRLAHLKPRVITLAAPMWTDHEGAHNYPDDVKLTMYQASDDIVPFVPPFGYEQVSTAEVIAQMLPDMPPLMRARALEIHARKLMADLLHEGTRAATWAKVTHAHGLENYRAWLTSLPPEGEPQARAAA